jgi:hypothetical protein
MEFAIRTLRGWTVPVGPPITQAWNAFDEKAFPKVNRFVKTF